MLFFTRCFLCIGTIVVMAEGFGPDRLWDQRTDVIGAATRAAGERVESLCRTEPARCLAVAGAIASAGLPVREQPLPDVRTRREEAGPKLPVRARNGHGRPMHSPDPRI